MPNRSYIFWRENREVVVRQLRGWLWLIRLFVDGRVRRVTKVRGTEAEVVNQAKYLLSKQLPGCLDNIPPRDWLKFVGVIR